MNKKGNCGRRLITTKIYRVKRMFYEDEDIYMRSKHLPTNDLSLTKEK